MSTAPRFTIWSPPYRHNSAGIRALRVLRDELRERGHVAELHYLTDVDPKRDIVIYPEIIRDNPLGAKRIVRWLLNRANLPADGLWYTWARGIDPAADDAGVPLLTVNTVELDLFRPSLSIPTAQAAYWVHKGTVRPELIPPGAWQITHQDPPTRALLAERLARADHLLSFDPFSMLNIEAQLVHTPVLLVPNEKWTRADVEGLGWPMHGVAWSPDELDLARRHVSEARAAYLALCETWSRGIDLFAYDAVEHWA